MLSLQQVLQYCDAWEGRGHGEAHSAGLPERRQQCKAGDVAAPDDKEASGDTLLPLMPQRAFHLPRSMHREARRMATVLAHSLRSSVQRHALCNVMLVTSPLAIPCKVLVECQMSG